MRNALRWLLLAVALSPGAVLAQGAGARDARLQALDAAADSAYRRLARYDDSVRRANERLDSIEVGPIRILAEPSIAGLAARAAQMALDSLPHLGSTVQRVQRYTYVMRVERFNRWGTNLPDSNVIVEVFDRSGPAMVNIRQRHDATLLARALRMYVPFLVVRDASPSFVSWMGGFISLDTLGREDWRLIRFGLVSSPAAVARRCYGGDVPACAITLQFTPVSDPVRHWYDAGDRLRIVKRSETTALRVDGIATHRCIKEGDDGSCASLLRRYPPNMLPDPAPIQTRASLARFAITLGGAGAVERMLDGERQPLERLSMAAKVPVDTLMRRWQESARDIRSSSRDLSAEIALGAIFWSLALGALSLGSSRWR